MFNNPDCQVIALEEHYRDPILAPRDDTQSRSSKIADRLYDVGDLRLGLMDEAGIDIQVLSHGSPSTQKLKAGNAAEVARGVNDRLYEIVQRHPDRFRGFAAIPTAVPEAAADELERCVTDLGFVGTMIHGMTGGKFHDDRFFWPIYERAQALDVPVYFHPSKQHQGVVDAYYPDHPYLAQASWGYTIDTATQAIRMVVSGVFQEYPRLKVVLGHLGETLPFLLHRIDETLKRPGGERVAFRDIFTKHFYITTSGNFSTPALLCCLMEMGVDRILYSVDYPHVDNMPGTAWMKTVPLSAEDKQKILCGNARRLLKL
ncbi:MAG: hypothetical protein RLZ98_1871 [Pseudomonadota bacterium]